MSEVVRLLLAAVLAIAGLAKLADRAGTRQAVVEFGLPRGLAAPAALGLPLVELALAGTLVPAATARGAAAVAAAVLLSFALLIALRLAQGRRPSCHCFGRLHSTPIGPWTLLRALGLAAVAAGLLVAPGAAISRLELGLAAVAFALVALATACVLLLRRYGRALNRLEAGEGARPQLSQGDHARLFSSRVGESDPVSLLDLLRRGRPVLLVFADPECGPCRALLPEVAAWQRELSSRLTVAVVDAREVAELYGIVATPSGVLVGSDGRLAAPIAVGTDAIRSLAGAPAEASAPTTPRPRIAVAAAALGAAVAAPLGQAAADPELEALRTAIESASPGLAEASRRSSAAVRKAVVFVGRSRTRAKAAAAAKPAAAKALAAERTKILALRGSLGGLPATSVRAYNAKTTAMRGLSLLAQSLEKRRAGILAAPAARAKRFAESERLLLRALDSIALSAQLMVDG